MKIRAFIEGNLAEELRKEGANADIAVSAGVTAATVGLKNAYRAQITTARLGRRLANTWRGDVYQPGRINAAGFVHTKAASIISAYAQGALITAGKGLFLAIPTREAGRAGRRRITPARWEKAHGQKLQFVPRPGGNPLLIAAGKSGAPDRVMFILVRQVSIAKRFDVDKPAQEARDQLPQLVLDNWPSSEAR